MAERYTFDISVDNRKLFMRALEEQVHEALEVCGGTAEGYAIDLCPVGTEESTGIIGYKGGSLRSSIRHEFVGDDTVEVKAGGIDGIYQFVNYAVYVELGTVKMKAQPYLMPAFEDHLEVYKNIIERALKE